MVTVTTSLHWAPLEDEEMDHYLLRYDIQDMTGDWLISGPKRGDFRAEVCPCETDRNMSLMFTFAGRLDILVPSHFDCTTSRRAFFAESNGDGPSTPWEAAYEDVVDAKL